MSKGSTSSTRWYATFWKLIRCKRPVPLRLAAALEWLKSTCFKCLLVMTLLCLGLRENYPFSNFPMFSSFNSRADLLYLTDAQGKPVSTMGFGLSNSTLNKIFGGWRRAELEKTAGSWEARVAIAEHRAGEALLRYIDRQASVLPQIRNLPHGLRVQHLTIHLEGHDLLFETRTIATHE